MSRVAIVLSERLKKKGRNLALSRGYRPIPDFTGLAFGGGGGNRTRVRRRYVPGATCL